MSQPRKKTDYERTRDIWYAKLKTEGFVDIEHLDGSLNIGIPRSIMYQDPDLRHLTEAYYCMAYHFLNNYEFDNELEKVMWEYHTNGLGVRNIAKALKKAEIISTNRNKVWKIIKKLEDKMKSLYLAP